MPQCGFSARTVQALQAVGTGFESVDILRDPELRQGIKEFSEWPTIPQLYIDGEFVGGCDIVTQMMATGELHQALGVSYEPPKPPTLHLSESFIQAIRSATEELGGGREAFPRIQVSPRWEYGIGFSPKGPGDLEVEVDGLTFLVDPSSAERAEGMKVDFRDGPQGGVVIDNPNEPPSVRGMDVSSLRQLMDEQSPVHLFDVRTEEEWNTARIEGATLLDAEGVKVLEALPSDATIVLHCHHGVRSLEAARRVLSQGYRNVFNLNGGIDAWSVQVDPTVPRY
jgi:monothiol glutaredoxin